MFCIFWRDNTFRSELFLSTCACFHEAFSRNCNTFFFNYISANDHAWRTFYSIPEMHPFDKCVLCYRWLLVCPWTKYFTDFNINLLKVHFDNGTVQRHMYIHNVLFKVAYQWHAPKTLLKTYYHDHLLFWNKK